MARNANNSRQNGVQNNNSSQKGRQNMSEKNIPYSLRFVRHDEKAIAEELVAENPLNGVIPQFMKLAEQRLYLNGETVNDRYFENRVKNISAWMMYLYNQDRWALLNLLKSLVKNSVGRIVDIAQVTAQDEEVPEVRRFTAFEVLSELEFCQDISKIPFGRSIIGRLESWWLRDSSMNNPIFRDQLNSFVSSELQILAVRLLEEADASEFESKKELVARLNTFCDDCLSHGEYFDQGLVHSFDQKFLKEKLVNGVIAVVTNWLPYESEVFKGMEALEFMQENPEAEVHIILKKFYESGEFQKLYPTPEYREMMYGRQAARPAFRKRYINLVERENRDKVDSRDPFQAFFGKSNDGQDEMEKVVYFNLRKGYHPFLNVKDIKENPASLTVIVGNFLNIPVVLKLEERDKVARQQDNEYRKEIAEDVQGMADTIEQMLQNVPVYGKETVVEPEPVKKNRQSRSRGKGKFKLSTGDEHLKDLYVEDIEEESPFASLGELFEESDSDVDDEE